MVVKLESEIEALQNDIFYFIKDMDDSYLGASKFYIDVIGSVQDVAQLSGLIAKFSHEHLHNNHKALKKKQAEELLAINDRLIHLFAQIREVFDTRTFDRIVLSIKQEKQALLDSVQESIQRQSNVHEPKNRALRIPPYILTYYWRPRI